MLIQVRPQFAKRRAISSSRGRHSGSVELQEVENASSGGHTPPADVISSSHRSGLGAEAHPLAVVLATVRLPEFLRCLVAMQSACHFPANGCCRSGGDRPCRASRTTAENRQRIPQDSSDGEISSGGANYLGRGSSPRQAFLTRSIWGRRGCFYTDSASLQDEASLYRGGQYSNFTV
jgi:hypothetical protein